MFGSGFFQGRRRAVITGVGVVAPGGTGIRAFWDLLGSGRTATRAVSHFDASRCRSRVAGECDFDPVQHGLSASQVRRLDRAAQLAVAASREAVTGSGLDLAAVDPSRAAVVLGCSAARTGAPAREYIAGHRRGDRAFMAPPSTAVELTLTLGATGPARIVSTGCTAGLDAVAHAAELVVDGIADVVVAGGTEAPLSTVMFACFDLIGATSLRNDEPERACRPFDRTRDGLVLAEGAAVLVVEELGSALRRGAHVYAEVAGSATRCEEDGADGRELSVAINSALRHARVDPGGVDYVSAYGSASQLDDVYETRAIKRSLGQHAYSTPISGVKSMIGHSLSAAGALSVAGSLLALEEGVIAPTANLYEPDPLCDLDYVPLVARQRRVDTVLTVGSGYGGFQSAIVLRRVCDA
jgi:minimal PKS ketosynthase (KS/KS alpha)